MHLNTFFKVNLFFNTLSAKEIVTLESIDTGTSKLWYKTQSTELYEIENSNTTAHPSAEKLIDFILNKEIFEFKIGNKDFSLYPRDCIFMTVNGKRKLLGKFKSISTTQDNVIVLNFKNGDRSLIGKRHKCTVTLRTAKENSYKFEIGEHPSAVVLSLAINEAMIVDKNRIIGIISKEATIGSKVSKLLKETVLERQRKLLFANSQRNNSTELTRKNSGSQMNNTLLKNIHSITSDRIKKLAEGLINELNNESNQESEDRSEKKETPSDQKNLVMEKPLKSTEQQKKKCKDPEDESKKVSSYIDDLKNRTTTTSEDTVDRTVNDIDEPKSNASSEEHSLDDKDHNNSKTLEENSSAEEEEEVL
ncbi:hypothetical protein GINT2_002143 [Glugoides intestinalis]